MICHFRKLFSAKVNSHNVVVMILIVKHLRHLISAKDSMLYSVFVC